jgi:hypothetical protein
LAAFLSWIRSSQPGWAKQTVQARSTWPGPANRRAAERDAESKLAFQILLAVAAHPPWLAAEGGLTVVPRGLARWVAQMVNVVFRQHLRLAHDAGQSAVTASETMARSEKSYCLEGSMRNQWRRPTRPSRAGPSNRRLVGVNEGWAHAVGGAPLFTCQASAFLAPGLA